MSEYIELDQLPRCLGGQCTQCSDCMTDHVFQQRLQQTAQYGAEYIDIDSGNVQSEQPDLH
jgi:hypothetical protein